MAAGRKSWHAPAVLVPAWFFAAAAHADPTPTAGGAPLPILDDAQADLGALGTSRFALAVALTGPGLLYVGDFARRSFSWDAPLPALAAGSGLTLEVVGVAATLTGPPLLLASAHRSRRSIEAQALGVRGVPVVIGYGLWAGAVGVAVGSVVTNGGILEPRPENLFALGAYVGSVGCGALQLAWNDGARRGAGWVSVIPQRDGFALVGRL